MSGTLYVVATPIGNLADLTGRAAEVLGSVALVAAEDTRRTGRLLEHLGIRASLLALNEHNESERLEQVLARLRAGEDVALVSDAGTPLVSDPGFALVRAARAAGLTVLPVPGASAVFAALSVSGLPTDRFLFAGFLPARPGARREALQALVDRRETLVLFEATHRIRACLDDLADAFGADRPAFLAREMTKLHEQYLAGTLGELARAFDAGGVPARGEFVLVVGGNPDPAGKAEQQARELLAVLGEELPSSRAARVAARLTGLPRQACYRLAEEYAPGFDRKR